MSLKYSQIKASIEPLLEHLQIHLPYLTPTCWKIYMRQSLYQHNNVTVTITGVLKVPLKSRFDQLLHNVPASWHKSCPPVYPRNHALGQDKPQRPHVCKHHITAGQRRPDQSINRLTWPRQEQETKSQTKLWTRFTSSAYLRYGNKWRQSETPAELTRGKPARAPTQYPAIHAYLSSSPIWLHPPESLRIHCE